MGCLRLSVRDVTHGSVSLHTGDGNSGIDIVSRLGYNPMLVAMMDGNSGLSHHEDNRNSRIGLDTWKGYIPMLYGMTGKNVEVSVRESNHNSGLSLGAALVCRVGLGQYEYFFLAEGPLVVADGYFKVLK